MDENLIDKSTPEGSEATAQFLKLVAPGHVEAVRRDIDKIKQSRPHIRNMGREDVNSSEGPSEEYLAYRCRFLDSIAQDTKFSFPSQKYEEGGEGVCREADFAVDLDIYLSGRRQDEQTFVTLYRMTPAHAKEFYYNDMDRLQGTRNMAAKYHYRASLAYGRQTWTTVPFYGPVRREARIAFFFTALSCLFKILAIYFEFRGAWLIRREQRETRISGEH